MNKEQIDNIITKNITLVAAYAQTIHSMQTVMRNEEWSEDELREVRSFFRMIKDKSDEALRALPVVEE